MDRPADIATQDCPRHRGVHIEGYDMNGQDRSTDDASSSNPAQQWARDWAAKGQPVFPAGNGKAPATPHGFYDATTDPAQVEAWIAAGHTAFNAAGGHRVIWLDADTDNAKRVREGKKVHVWGDVEPEDVLCGAPIGVDPDTRAGHYAFQLPADWPVPPRDKPSDKDPSHLVYDLSKTPVSVGANLAGSNCIDWRCWGGYVKLKGPPPDAMPQLPTRLKRQLERARGLSGRRKQQQSDSKKIRSVEQAVEHLKATAHDGRHPALGRAVMPLVRCHLAGDAFDPEHEAVKAIVAAYEGIIGNERNARDEVHRDFRSAFEEVAGDFKEPGKPKKRKDSLGMDAVQEELGGANTLDPVLKAQRLRLRYDIRWRQPQIFYPGQGWTELDDLSEENLKVRCDAVRWKVHVWKTILGNTLYHHRVDPFLQHLEALPKWDGIARVDDWAAISFRLKDGNFNARAASWAGRHIFMGAVKRTLDPGAKLDVTPVLVGEQGMGKSWHLEKLFPAELRGAFGDELNMGGQSKAMVEALQGKVLVEIAEMHGMGRAKLDMLKAFMTRTSDNSIRGAYMRNVVNAARRCVFVGTINDDGTGVLPEDPTGNRRWCPIFVEGHGRRPDQLDEGTRGQLWAEALHRVRAGESPVFPEDMVEAQALVNDEHRIRDHLEDRVAAIELDCQAQYAAEPGHPGFLPSKLWEMAGLLGEQPEDGGEGEGQARVKGMAKTAAQVSESEAKRFARALWARKWRRPARKVRIAGSAPRLTWIPPAPPGNDLGL